MADDLLSILDIPNDVINNFITIDDDSYESIVSDLGRVEIIKYEEVLDKILPYDSLCYIKLDRSDGAARGRRLVKISRLIWNVFLWRGYSSRDLGRGIGGHVPLSYPRTSGAFHWPPPLPKIYSSSSTPRRLRRDATCVSAQLHACPWLPVKTQPVASA